MSTVKRFILIDDDAISNKLNKFLIDKTVENVEIKILDTPETVLEWIESDYSTRETVFPTIILLEINMEVMSGWELLDAFSEFTETIKQHFAVYILSSSIYDKDKERVHSYPVITDYIEKPLTTQTVRRIIFMQDFKKKNAQTTQVRNGL